MKKTNTFQNGQRVKFYVKRFRKWFEGTVEGEDESLTKEVNTLCYHIRTDRGFLWGVENTLIKAL